MLSSRGLDALGARHFGFTLRGRLFIERRMRVKLLWLVILPISGAYMSIRSRRRRIDGGLQLPGGSVLWSRAACKAPNGNLMSYGENLYHD